MERTEEENGHLQEAVSSTFSHDKRVEDKFGKYASGKSETTNNLLEKLNNMEGKCTRFGKTNADYRQKLDIVSGGGGGN